MQGGSEEKITSELTEETRTGSRFGRRADSSNSSSGGSPTAPKPIVNLSIAGNIIPYNKIDFTGEILGEGGFGIVKKAMWQYTPVAVKELKANSLTTEATEEFQSEAQHHGSLRHPNIVTLYGACIEAGHYCMVMELMPAGSLYEMLHNKKDFPWNNRLAIAEQIAIGLNYLHEQHIIHRDLKSLNVLLDNQLCAKLTDFGLSRIKTETKSIITANKVAGSLLWTAPELFKRRSKHTELTDIYAFGVLIWELASRKLPFEEASGNQTLVMQWVTQEEREEIPEETPADFAELIKCCWAQNPENRPQKAAAIVQKLQAIMKPKQKILLPKVWHFDPHLERHQAEQVKIKGYELIPAQEHDFQKVLEQYQHYPPSGYDLAKVEVIYNPTMNRMFAQKLEMLERRHGNAAYKHRFAEELFIADRKSEDFKSKQEFDELALFKQMDDKKKIAARNKFEESKQWRIKIHNLWETMSAGYVDCDYPNVKLLPLWHGSSPGVLDSIFTTGYANLATTDSGYFGKGLYSAHEAEYSWRCYSKGALILNWVSMFSAYPVIDGDMPKLIAHGNYQNYDAHFIPVVPDDPNNLNTDVYYPCLNNQKHEYIEVVVFNDAQCLPRYLVTLQPTLPKSIAVPTLQKPKINPTPENIDILQAGSANTSHKEKATKDKSNPTIEQVNPSIVAPKPVLFSVIAKPKPISTSTVNPQELKQFLHHVGYGEQAEAEAMLQKDKNLALAHGDLTDCSVEPQTYIPRTWKNITGFQYAVLALDYHMWTMILKYISLDDASQQIAEIKTKATLKDKEGWIIKPGDLDWPQTGWTPLIEALDIYIKNYSPWTAEQRRTHWCQQVGGAQLILPAHVINEYSHPTRPFYPCPKWQGEGELLLPREGVAVWTNTIHDKLGSTFGWARGDLGESVADGGLGLFARAFMDGDRAACVELLKSRTEQAHTLVSKHTAGQSHRNAPRP